MTKKSNPNSAVATTARASLAGQAFNAGKGFDATRIESLDPEIIKNIVTMNDLSAMTAKQKVEYINMLCASLGLNPLSKPLQICSFKDDNAQDSQKGKTERVYATRDCTDQLRRIYGISFDKFEKEKDTENKLYNVTVWVSDKTGRTDFATGSVSLQGMYTKQGETKKTVYDLTGQSLGNALMKAETKAKRRATLSICGLGFLDETELETIPGGVAIVDLPEPVVAEAPEENLFEKCMSLIEAATKQEELEFAYSVYIAKPVFDSDTQDKIIDRLNTRAVEIEQDKPTAPELLAKVKGLIDAAENRDQLAGIMKEYIDNFKPEAIRQKFINMLNARREEIKKIAAEATPQSNVGGLFKRKV